MVWSQGALATRSLRVPGVDRGDDASGRDVIHVAGDAHLRGEQRRGEQALDVSLDGGVRVGDGGRFEYRLVDPGRRGSLLPEAGVGEKAGPALRVVDDRDLE